MRSDPIEALAAARRRAQIALVAANVLFPGLLFLSNVRRPWEMFDGEASPINWFSSVQCVVVGVIAFGVYLASRAGREAGHDPARRSWPWLLLALGFAFLGFDEAFEVHENIREGLLKPHGIFTGIRGFKSGDIVLGVYVAAGAVVAWYLLQDLKRYRSAMLLFGTALALIAFLAFQDALTLDFLFRPAVRHVQIVAEEVGEVWAQMLFGHSLIVVLCAKLGEAARGTGGR